MTKWKVIRISEAHYNRLIKDAAYGETIDSIIGKLLDVTETTKLQQNTGGKK